VPASPRERINCGRLSDSAYEALQRQAGQGPRASWAYVAHRRTHDWSSAGPTRQLGLLPASASMVRVLFRDDVGWVGGRQPDRAIGAGVQYLGQPFCVHTP